MAIGGGLSIFVGGLIWRWVLFDPVAAGAALFVGTFSAPMLITMGSLFVLGSLGDIGYKIYKKHKEQKNKNEIELISKWELKQFLEIFGDIIRNNNLEKENYIIFALEENSIVYKANKKFSEILGIKYDIDKIKVISKPNVHMESSIIEKNDSKVAVSWKPEEVINLKKSKIFEIKIEIEMKLNVHFPDYEWLNNEINDKCKEEKEKIWKQALLAFQQKKEKK